MINNKISIKLPNYIRNVFLNSSVDGEIDYLKSIFDDRNFNINAFYILNFEVYKGLLLDDKYEDKDFLKIKKNLFYCSNSRLIIEEIDFSFSKYYNTEDFIEKELNNSGTEFDKFCTLIFKENLKGILKYLRNLKGINDILKNKVINNIFEYDVIIKKLKNKNKSFFIIKNIFSSEELVNYIKNQDDFIFRFITFFLSKKGLEYLKRLNVKDSLFLLIKDNNSHILDEILDSDVAVEFIKYLDIESTLREGFENYNDNMFILSHLLYHKQTIEYLDDLGLNKALLKEKNRNFDWLIEKLCRTEYGMKYLESMNNDKIKKLLLKNNQIDIKKINNPDIIKEELQKIKKGKIKLEDKLHQILRSEEGIKFLEENYDNEEISKELIKNPRLFTSICNTECGVKYLKNLNIDNEVIKQIKEESNKGQVFALLAHLLMNDEGIRYLKDLNRNDILKEFLLKEVLIFSRTQFNNLDKYKDLYIKENFISALQGKHSVGEGIDSTLHSLSDTQEGIRIIIEADVKDKVRKSILETKDYHYMYTLRFFNDTPEGKQYLKDILNLETDNIKNQVYNFIETSDSGSCLLSGYRGTGKTSLLNSVIKKLQDNSEEEIVKVVINIPEQQNDKNGKKKSFNKNELITKIIRQIYLSLVEKGFSKKDIENFEDQYIRTFKNIEEINGFLKIQKRGFLRLAIDILSFSIPIFSGLFINYLLGLYSVSIFGFTFGLGLDTIKLFIAFLLILLNFLVFRTIFNANFRARIERTLYNEDVAEYKLNENICYFTQPKNIINKKYFLKDIFNKIFITFTNIGKTKKRKLVIIIDELDKLLDLDKGIGNGSIDMKDIFDLLGKLKTLFFDNTGAIFFVVTNKDAYNYYLENKHSEDDLISNIFNKVLYLPMIKKENFNINRTFKIEGIDKKNNDKDDRRKNHFFNDWIYYKSHGNWRKANFILNQKLNNQTIKLDKVDIEYDMKFYDFMNILYYLFIENDTENDNQKFDNNFVPGRDFYEFVDKFILSGEYIKIREYEDDYQGIIKKLISSIYKLRLKKENILIDELRRKIEELLKKYKDSQAFDTFAYIYSSVDKISNQSAYRDYVINSILNIIEILKHDRTLRIEDIFVKLKFTELDLKYPAFDDLVLVYIPFMIYYFNNINEND